MHKKLQRYLQPAFSVAQLSRALRSRRNRLVTWFGMACGLMVLGSGCYASAGYGTRGYPSRRYYAAPPAPPPRHYRRDAHYYRAPPPRHDHHYSAPPARRERHDHHDHRRRDDRHDHRHRD